MNPREKRIQILAIPIREKRLAPQLGTHRAAIVTGSAFRVVHRPTSLGLLGAVHAATNGAARRLSGRDRREHRDGAENRYTPNTHGRPNAIHSAGSSLP